MGRFNLNIPSLGNKFVDHREPILGDSFYWHWERPFSEVRYLAIHHTAGPDAQTPDEIAAYHVNSLGWGGIGYHFVIAKNGTVYYVGDLTTARAHVLNYNHLAVGICLVGNFMGGKKPSDAQLQSAHLLCAHLLFATPEIPGIDGWEDVVPHKQLQATSCPGDNWDEWRQKILSGAEEIDQTKRAQEITALYKMVLGREPDQAGLADYISSNLKIEEIRASMTESPEHQHIIRKAQNFKEAVVLATESLVLLSQAKQKIEKIASLNV